MKTTFEYSAFISYKSEDVAIAKSLQKRIERYKLPVKIAQEYPDEPRQFNRVFEYRSEMSGGYLKPELQNALKLSKYLIVVCTPNAPKSRWMSEEISYFINECRAENESLLEKAKYIIPYIVSSNSDGLCSDEDCFPEPMKQIFPRLRGISEEEMGTDAAIVKVVAYMHGIKFDKLWERHEREKKKTNKLVISGLSLFTVFLMIIGSWIYGQNIKIEKINWRLLENQARAVAARADELVDSGDSYTARVLCLNVMPNNFDNPNRPYVPAVEKVLRKALKYDTATLRNEDCVTSVCYDTTERIIASATTSGNINLWDALTGQKLKTIKSTGNIHSVAFNKNGTSILCSGWTAEDVQIWNILDGKCERQLKGHNYFVTFSTFSSHDALIASASKDNTIRLWNSDTGECINVLHGHQDGVNSVLFSSDDKWLLSSSDDKTVKLWNVDDGKCIMNLDGHSTAVEYASFNPENDKIVSGDANGVIKIWRLADGKCVKTIYGHEDAVRCVKFSPDGRMVVSSSGSMSKMAGDNTIKFWNSETGELMKSLSGHSGPVNSIAFNKTGNALLSASTDETVMLWDLREPDDRNLCKTLDVAKGKDNEVIWLSLRPSDGLLSAACSDHTIRLWNVNDDVCYDTLYAHDKVVSFCQFSRNEDLLLSSGADKVLLWKPAEKTNRLLDDRYWLCNPSFSKDGEYIVTGNMYDEIVVWSTDSLGCVVKFDSGLDKGGFLKSVVFDNSGDHVLATSATWGNDSCYVCVYDWRNKKCIKKWCGHSGTITDISMSPDGDFFATSSWDGTVKIWRINNFELYKTLKGHKSLVNSIEYAPTGNYLLSASNDNTVRVWDVSSGAEVDILYGHRDFVRYACFDKTGTFIYSASEDGTIKVWRFVPIRDMVYEERSRFANRCLTETEAADYYIDI